MTVSAANPARLRVQGLRYAYAGAAPVLDELDLEVAAGERVAILGPNGSGKTTFALHLNGLLTPQSGVVEIGGVPISPESLNDIRRIVGMVFQDPDDQLFMHTVGDDVAFGPANLGVPPEQLSGVVDDALDAVGAAGLTHRTPHHLSGGEKRRVSIATVLAMHPQVLVMDEPTAGLDPVGRRELGELLLSLPQTQIVVTHDLPFALATCPRAVILSDGGIAEDAPTAELLSDPALLAQYRLELPWGFTLSRRG